MLLLLLRLEAPLMKWGLRSLWNDRDTHSVPTKSGIIGLLSCALGYPRGDKRIEELSAQLSMGVRADRNGIVLTDLQIVSTASNPFIKNLNAANYKARVGEGGLLTYRHYLQDASFTVALSGNSILLKELAEAVYNPIFSLYLGAKCCIPSRPIFEALTNDYSSIEQALNDYPITKARARDRCQEKHYCEIEDKNGAHIRQDEIKVNMLREYGFRRVTVKYLGG